MAELFFNGYIDDTPAGRAVLQLAREAGFTGMRYGSPSHYFLKAPGSYRTDWTVPPMRAAGRERLKVVSIQGFGVPKSEAWKTPASYTDPAENWRACRPPLQMAAQIAKGLVAKTEVELEAYVRGGGLVRNYELQVENELRNVQTLNGKDTNVDDGTIDQRAHELLEVIVPVLRAAFPCMQIWSPSVWGWPLERLTLAYIDHFASLDGHYRYPQHFDGWTYNHYPVLGSTGLGALERAVKADDAAVHARFDLYSCFGMDRKPRMLTEFGGSQNELKVANEVQRGAMLERLLLLRSGDARPERACFYTVLNSAGMMENAAARMHGVLRPDGSRLESAQGLVRAGTGASS